MNARMFVPMFFTLIVIGFAAADTCVSTVQSLPASCTGNITSDAMSSGCRVISCSQGANTIIGKACDKSGFFEVYRQSATATPPKVCFGSTCVQVNGYAKSANYPFCFNATTPNTTNTTTPITTNTTIPTTNVTPNTCYSTSKTMPVSCQGAEVTQDVIGGCRTVTCSNASSTTKVLACDKGSFFEMYKQSQTGTPIQVCIGTTCLRSEGYVKSNNFPICTAPQYSADITFDPLFPQDHVAVMNCNANFPATSWSWNFGDGTSTTKSGTLSYQFGTNDNGGTPFSRPNNRVYKAYAANGSYTISCTASNGTASATTTRQLQVASNKPGNGPGSKLFINKLSGNSYALRCDAVGMVAGTVFTIYNGSTSWQFGAPYGDYSEYLNFTFPSPGTYTVECSSRTGDDRYREIYYSGDAGGYTPCNAATGCISTYDTATVTVANDLIDGLYAYYKEEGNHNDAIGSRHGTSIGNVQPAAGKMGNAFSYDGHESGSDARTYATLGLSGAPQVSTSAWFKANIYPSGNLEAIYRYAEGSWFGLRVLSIHPETHKLTWQIGEGDGAAMHLNSTTIIQSGQWYHVVTTWDKQTNQSKLYVNGVLEAQGTLRSFGQITDQFFWGAQENGYGINGTIDEIGVWTRVLSDADVAALYNNGQGRTFGNACFAAVNTTAATCTGGDIIFDGMIAGCRQIFCIGGANAIQVKACDKPSGAAQYFEMYRLNYSGVPPKVCINSTCIQNNGFAKSGNYPICS